MKQENALSSNDQKNLLNVIFWSVGGDVGKNSSDGVEDVVAVGKVVAGLLENTFRKIFNSWISELVDKGKLGLLTPKE